jgi:ABC-type transport system substrate-binding protein
MIPAAAALIPLAARWTPAADYVRGSPNAVVGGVRRDRFPQQPHMLHPLNATDLYGNRILDLIYETLAQTDVDSLEQVPLLAEKWEVSPDKLTYVFHINPAARWQDGKPVTAADVKFSFDVLFNPRLKTRPKWQAYFSNFEKAEAVDARTVRFVAKQDHFRNFINLSSLRIVPKAAFADADPDQTELAKKPLGSGPYKFGEWNRGTSVILERDANHWAKALPQNIGRYNPEKLLIRFVAADKVALESFKRGDVDILQLTPDQWVNETGGPEFGLGAASRKRLIKVEVKNQAPRNYRYVTYNLASPLFNDKRVRKAMSLLYDRDTFVDKFYHGLQVKAVGPFEANSRYTSPAVKPLAFSVPEAIHLLREAGWQDSDGDGLLDKDGTTFRYTVMTADPETSVKMLTLAKEAMRQAGVEMNIKVVDWSTFLSLIDDYKFDAVMLGWTRDPWPDPTPLWHSRGAVKGGLNLARYRNPAVDKLIDEGVKSIPDERRIQLFRRLHEILAEDQPYTFLLEPDRTLIGYSSRLRTVKPWYAYTIGEDYWWFEKQVK